MVVLECPGYTRLRNQEGMFGAHHKQNGRGSVHRMHEA